MKIDTSNILFICAGAFEGLFSKENKILGFNSSVLKEDIKYNDLLKKYGIIPELLGRLPVITILDELTIDELKKILITPSNSLTKQYKKIFENNNLEISFFDDSLDYIATCAKKENAGARSLRKILDEMLLDTLFELPYTDGTTKLEIRYDKINKIKK